MTVPVITPLPPAPTRADAPSDFTAKADAFVAAQVGMVTEINDSAAFVDQRAIDADDSATAAAAAAAAAADQAQLVTSNGQAQVEAATEQADRAALEAARSEDAAEQSQLMASAAQAAAGLPAIEGNAGRLLGVRADGSGVEYREQYPAMADKGGRSLIVQPDGSGVMFADPTPVADVLITARDPGLDYLRADGSIYLKSAWPELASEIGTVGGEVGKVWSPPASGPTVGGLATDHRGVWVSASGANIYRSADDGLTWVEQSVLPSGSFGAGEVATDGRGKWIAMSQTSGWAATSTDDGQTWTVGIISGHNNLRSFDTDGQGTWMLYSYSSGIGSDRLRRLIDDGGWVDLGTINGSNGKTFCMHAGGSIWIAGHATAGSISRSNDNGETWVSIATGMGASAVKLVKSRTTPGVLVLVGGSGAAARSEDYGSTWSVVDVKLGATNLSIAEAGPDGVMLVSGGSLWSRSVDDGKTWKAMPNWTSATRVRLSDTGTGIKGNPIERSTPSFPYDTATQFAVPKVAVPVGMRAYIRARAEQ